MLYPNIYMLNNVRHNWDKVAKYIKENQNGAEKIIVSRFNLNILVDKYYDGDLPIIGFLPIKNKNDDENLNLVIYNWMYYYDQENINKISEYIDSDQKVILMSAELQKKQALKQWFLERISLRKI